MADEDRRAEMKSGALGLLMGAIVASAIAVTWHGRKTRNSAGGQEGPSTAEVGSVLDTYRGVPVYENGSSVTTSHGKHYATDGYYYGQKWQCVEYIKRFYHDAKNHDMPSVWGHGRDFFDPSVGHGAVNPQRGLRQFENGGSDPPQVDDLLVFRAGSLGHVAVVSEVTETHVEVVQQNIHGHPRARHVLVLSKGRYLVGDTNGPAGWLRLP